MYKDIDFFEKIPDETIVWRYLSLDKFLYMIKNKKLYFNRTDNFQDSKECTLTTLDEKIFENVDKNYWEKERQRNYICCWIESPIELALMWETYGKKGVALKTTIGRIKKSLSCDKEHDVNISRVKYIDYQIDSSQQEGMPLNLRYIPLTKRNFFEQEHEIRLIYFCEQIIPQKGIELSIDIDSLIEQVIVHPHAPKWFLGIINEELLSSGFNIKANCSKI